MGRGIGSHENSNVSNRQGSNYSLTTKANEYDMDVRFVDVQRYGKKKKAKKDWKRGTFQHTTTFKT